jgi:c-di-AMP phosphodiesterase-like protein
MGSSFYQKYKWRLFIGLGILIALDSVALVFTQHLDLGVFGFVIAMLGMSGLSYIDQREKVFLAKEVRVKVEDEIAAAGGALTNVGRLTLVLLQVDDYDEVFQGLTGEKRPLLVEAVDKYLRDWAVELRAYLRKDSRNRYLALVPAEELDKLEEAGFPIIEKIRQVKVDRQLPVTLSIGVGKVHSGGPVDASEAALLGQLAQDALYMALERGGDQVVVKSPEHTWFYGGSNEAVGKRRQVQSRVAAAELRRLFGLCTSVVIMGHRGIDFDVLGAGLGLAEAARHYGKKARIAVDRQGGAVERMLDVIAQHEPGLLVDGQEIASDFSPQTLLLVVDVHRPSMVAFPQLLTRAAYIGVIDHHRRSEEFLERANFDCLMPAASSASELVTELVRYVTDISISPLAATALLAGVIVDTKKFSFATSANTFRNAAWLRDAGADPVMIQSLFTDSLDVMFHRATLLQKAEIIQGRFALTMDDQVFPEAQMAASRAADTLLDVDKVEASFALYPIDDGVGISARSRGLVNVQRIMEQIGGGGNFAAAGARFKGIGLQEVRQRLLDTLSSVQEEKE